MRSARLVLCLIIGLSGVGCSSFGLFGSGSGDDAGFGDGNIPVASPGTELSDVNFEFDSAALSAAAQSVLRDNSRWILDNEDNQVVIEGHCDERGTAEYNLALGERRAQSVYNYLRSLGVQDEQISTISYGEELPLDPTSSEAAWAKNRRAHFAIKR